MLLSCLFKKLNIDLDEICDEYVEFRFLYNIYRNLLSCTRASLIKDEVQSYVEYARVRN